MTEINFSTNGEMKDPRIASP